MWLKRTLLVVVLASSYCYVERRTPSPATSLRTELYRLTGIDWRQINVLRRLRDRITGDEAPAFQPPA